MNKTRTLVITGGSSGIGLAICEQFTAQGYQVFNLDIQPGPVGEYIACDMTDHAAVQKAIAQIATKSAIDVLICNAGIHFSADILATTPEDLERVFAINVKGAFAATQAILPVMQQQQDGCVLYIASDQSVIGKTNSFAYNLSKHALASMAKTTALDFAKDNIRANALCPGTIDTPLYQNAINRYCVASGANPEEIHAAEAACQPLNRIGTAAEVASFALYLASPEASFITGSLQMMDGGYTAQ